MPPPAQWGDDVAMKGQQPCCPVCACAPTVAVAVAHRGLRNLILELLQRDHCCWQVHAVPDAGEFAGEGAAQPDLAIVDSAAFPLRSSFPAQHVVVIGPEPDPGYERVARRGGAGAWLARDTVGEDLSACARAVLGCAHGPNPGGRTTPAGDCPTTVASEES